jgi:hypothetical protein
MKNAVFRDVTPCGSCKYSRFEGIYLHHQGDKNWQARNVLRLLITTKVIPNSPFLVTLMMEAIYIPPKRRFFQEPHGATPQKTAFFSHRRGNLVSYIALTGWTL